MYHEKAKSRLRCETVARKRENGFTERKRGSQRHKCIYRVKPWLEEQKYAIDSITEIKHLLHVRKRLYREKTSLSKAKTRLPSENVPRKGENAFTERKRHSRRRIRDYQAKPNENVARKG